MITREQIDSTRSRLLSNLRGLTDNQVNWKRDADTWSISQVIQHVAMVEGRAPDIIESGLAQAPDYQASDVKVEQKVTDRSVKRNAPPPLQPSDEPKTLAELQHILDESHRRFVDIFERVKDDSRLDVTSPPREHLVLGKMSTRQWIEAVHYHEARHVEQVEEIIGLMQDR